NRRARRVERRGRRKTLQSSQSHSFELFSAFSNNFFANSAIKGFATGITMPARKQSQRASTKTAGYSGTPLPKKLGIRDNYSAVLINAPDRFERKLDPVPTTAKIVTDPKNANVAVLFAYSVAELVRDFRPLAKALLERTALWIAWPK